MKLLMMLRIYSSVTHAVAHVTLVIAGELQSLHHPEGHCCLFLTLYPILPVQDKTLIKKASANRFVYVFELTGIQPWVSQMQSTLLLSCFHSPQNGWFVCANSNILVLRAYKIDM